MNILDNIFVKKAMKSMMTPEQFETIQKFKTAVQSGKIDQAKLSRIGQKVSKLSTEEINGLLDVVEKNIK